MSLANLLTSFPLPYSISASLQCVPEQFAYEHPDAVISVCFKATATATRDGMPLSRRGRKNGRAEPISPTISASDIPPGPKR
ncbi:hypothetical protein VTI74DRAFT_10176 [Chaetomium olivicolor]